jgi:hypothetical protein
MKLQELQKQGKYIWRYKHIGFYNSQSPLALMRQGNEIDKWDKVFDSKADFDKWFKKTQIGLAELDEVMNYCKYFIREKGNEGWYERDGKRCEVNGLWDGYHIDGSALFPVKEFDYDKMNKFRDFLQQNVWLKDWFELRDKYRI